VTPSNVIGVKQFDDISYDFCQIWNVGKFDDLTAWVTWWRVANSAILNL